MSFSQSTGSSHAPFKDQVDDETVLFDLDNSMDVLPDTPMSKNFDVDSDTQRTQTNQSSTTVLSNTNKRENRGKSDTVLSRISSFIGVIETVNLEDIYEYEWADSDSETPEESNKKESYIVQEILADFLNVKSFKRKYPDLARRTMDAYERSWLQQEGIVPVGRADLGLTALRTDDVMKLLQQDYPDVHIALTDLFRRRRFQAAAEIQKRQYEAARIERGEARAEAARRRAMDSAADFNHRLVSERLGSRRCYWDLQTMQIHVPQRVYKLLDSSYPNGAYPVAVIPGQFAEYFINFTSEQLSHLPLSRALYPQPSRKHKLPPPLPTNLRFGSIKPKASSPIVASGEYHEQNVTSETCRFVERLNSNVNAMDDSRIRNPSNEIHGQDLVSSSPRPFKSSLEFDTDVPKCNICNQIAYIYLRCSECKVVGHPKCLDVPDSMLPGVRSYDWSCMECKRCVECHDSGQEDQMMFCDRCDRGYHAFCVGLNRIPDGKWECSLCISQRPTPKRGRIPNAFKVKTPDYGKNVKFPKIVDMKSPKNPSKPGVKQEFSITYEPSFRQTSEFIKSSELKTPDSEPPKRRRGRPPSKNRFKNPLLVPPVPIAIQPQPFVTNPISMSTHGQVEVIHPKSVHPLPSIENSEVDQLFKTACPNSQPSVTNVNQQLPVDENCTFLHSTTEVNSVVHSESDPVKT